MLFVCCISLWESFIYTPKWVQQWDTYSKKVITENQNFQVCKPLNVLCNKINDITCKTKKYSIKMNPEFSQNVYLNPNRIWIHTFLQIYLQVTKRKVSSGPFKATWFKPLLTFWQLWDFSSAIMVKWVESSQLKMAD